MADKHIIVVADPAALVEEAAKRIVGAVEAADGPAAICLTGGGTPKPVYERLAQEPYLGAIAWQRTHWFWGDDRFVPLEDERSNAAMALAAFLTEAPAPKANIHRMKMGAGTPDEAAGLYQQELADFYGAGRLDAARPLFDLVMLGLGSDGHTASLFPGLAGPMETEKWAVGVPHAGLAPFVPRVSLTFPALASCREMLFLVCGRGKREVLGRVLAGEDLPAAVAHSAGPLTWLVDREAAPEAYPLGSTALE